MDRRPSLVTLLPILLCFQYVFSHFQCIAGLYGKPAAKDCFELYEQLPGNALSPHVKVDVPRSFVEPKFLQPRFCPVPNPFATEMVQLPKIWRQGQSQYCF